MSAAHTPGPWLHVGGTDKRMAPFIRVVGDQPGIAAVAQVCSRGAASEQAANARLIAAAPDMLAALQRAEQFISNGIELGFIRMPDAETPDSAHQTPGIVRAAIAKAIGGAQ